jgi:phthalate 4,5-cis-dihydrodiol dehydrogenase
MAQFPREKLQTLQIGVVGLGLAGGVMVSAIKTHPAFTLAGATDLDSALRGRFAQTEGVPAHSNIEGLLADPAIEAVYIATPHQFHREHTVAALVAGKHVVVEKPMALALDDCDAMIAAASRRNLHLIVGHTHGFDPCLAQMRRVIDSGRLGRVGMIATANYTDFLYRPRRPEELDSARGGGILFNQLPHQIEMIRSLVAAPLRSVRAASLVLDRSRPTEGGCMAFLEFESGVSASLVYSGYDGFDTDEWHGWIGEGGFQKSPAHGRARRALGQVDADSESKLRRDRFGYGSGVSAGFPPAQPHFGTLVVTCEKGDLRQCPDGVRIYSEAGIEHLDPPKTVWRPGRGDVLEELRAAVRDGVEPLHDGRFGRETVAACLAIQRSANERREVFLSDNP